ncbi:type I-E CRISPR-associated protein Cse1/CasA [Laribacter hongkongensis]|uniref:type I-E CRISPR-associated protein Cse1/CasA n=1 Tax=Laribacter hongkongensis TaxID=168471 RepID=UPI001EFC9276|nr:type I-E CRISPR-associated protein Cse1/CasA [Laribacter hongkongensis]MCG9063931.1 type I-E CRISPR-associated protein Cse1/CasA [Laribacter hongkongensis]
MENRFNLIDEPWIPIADVGRISLGQLFCNPDYRALGGNPVQKIALMKLLLAISQAAATPNDETGWQALSEADLAGSCLAYLKHWHHRFYLYGDQPFLQMPAIARAEIKSYGTVLAEIATGNTTVLSQGQQERALDDADKALLLLTQMGFALSGKKTDNSVVLSHGYSGKQNDKGKPASGKAGPSMGFMGLLHNFVLGETLWQTLRLNLLTQQEIEQSALYPAGLGNAPWQAMPQGECCDIARSHQQSLMGRLVPVSRFCLLVGNGLHYSEGIAHPDYKSGGIDPSVAINRRGKDPKVLWVNPGKRPWRELTSLLGFLAEQQGEFDCLQLRCATRHACSQGGMFAIWSGGLRVSSNAGEQYVSGDDDYVESTAWLHAAEIGSFWYENLTAEMTALDALARQLYACVLGYYKAQLVDGKLLAEQATALFWQLCERHAQSLFDSCDTGEANHSFRHDLRKTFAAHLHSAFDLLCPNQTARQLDAWAKNRPNPGKYLQQEAS